MWRLAPRSEEGGAWRDYASAGRFLFREKKMKNNVFRKLEHHTSLVWHLAATKVLVVARTPTFFFAPANLNPFTTTLSSTNL